MQVERETNKPLDDESEPYALVENIFQSVADPLIFFNFDGVIRKVNRSVVTLLGWESRELIGRGVDLLLEKGEGFLRKTGLQKLIEEGEMKNHQVNFVSRKGKTIPVLLSGLAMRNKEGSLLGVVLVAKDVREQKRLDRLKDELLSTVSHELRTPLTIIKGTIENLTDGLLGPFSAKQMHALETIRKNDKRLERLVNNLLVMSRVEAGVEMKCGRVEIAPLVMETLEELQNEARERCLELTYDPPSSLLPDVWGDVGMIDEVLMNLLSNALRFARKRIVVTTRAVADDEAMPQGPNDRYVEIVVADDGVGIAPEDQPRLFGKFAQINRPEGGAGYKGTGLGLAICKNIVERHHGKIRVESIPEEGTKFSFILPQWKEAQSGKTK